MKINIVKKSRSVLNELRKSSSLKGNEYRVYEYLVSHANDSTGECFLLNRTICNDTGLHLTTVRRIIKKLIEKGYILKQMRIQLLTNENASNTYTICEMLDEFSLKIKKAYIEKYPKVKKDINPMPLMEEVMVELIAAQNSSETKEAVVETIESLETKSETEIETETETSQELDFLETIARSSNSWNEQYKEFARVHYFKDFNDYEIKVLMSYGESKFYLALEMAKIKYGKNFTYLQVKSVLDELATSKKGVIENEKVCNLW